MPTNFYKVIELKKETTFLGRNGLFRCRGLILAGFYDTPDKLIHIHPITSYAKPGRCKISFAMKDIDRMISALEKIKKENQEYEARKKKFKR